MGRTVCNIETVPRHGYRFIAEVGEVGGIVPDTSVLSVPTPSRQTASAVPASGVPESGVPEDAPTRHRFSSLTLRHCRTRATAAGGFDPDAAGLETTP
jgi:hypothetical protein